MIVFGSKERIMKYLLLLFSNYTRKPENEQNLQPGKSVEDPACSMEDKKNNKKKSILCYFQGYIVIVSFSFLLVLNACCIRTGCVIESLRC